MRFVKRVRNASVVVSSLAVAGLVAGVLIVCALALGFAWGARGLWTEEAAAWVQAIGSIIAIVVAICLAYAQSSAARKLHSEELELNRQLQQAASAENLKIQMMAFENEKSRARQQSQDKVKAALVLGYSVSNVGLRWASTLRRQLMAMHGFDPDKLYPEKEWRPDLVKVPSEKDWIKIDNLSLVARGTMLCANDSLKSVPLFDGAYVGYTDQLMNLQLSVYGFLNFVQVRLARRDIVFESLLMEALDLEDRFRRGERDFLEGRLPPVSAVPREEPAPHS